MPARRWVVPAALLAVALALAGCTGKDADAETPAPAPPTGSIEQPPAQTPPERPPPPPPDFALADAGEIAGSFEKTWEYRVANVAFRDANIHFALASLQAGAPPTARVNLALYDPNGALVKAETVGLGAAEALDWSFSPGQLPLAGTYQLKATTAQDSPLPSGGFGSYTLQGLVDY